jgi:hypothetical protein
MANTGPKEILIIRHGEKVGDPADDTTGGPDLAIQGSARAAALPALFLPGTTALTCQLAAADSSFSGKYKPTSVSGSSPRFDTPQFIFATKPSTGSSRPVETITPTSVALALSIDADYDNSNDPSKPQKGIPALVSKLFSDPKYVGQVVLICWHHGTIPALTTALHANPPEMKWDGKVFDLVWQITYDYSKGKPAGTCAQHKQKLLYGDS